MSPESLYSLLSLVLGFSVAGLLASLYQFVTARPPSFQLLSEHAKPSTVVTLPFLMLAAPFIIMRNTIQGRQIEDRSFGAAMLATIVAGFWSLMSGALVMKTIEALGLLPA
jgi:hypothetical protein